MIVAEVTGDVQTDYYYDESGNVFGFKRGNSEYYYIRNGQGDIIGILDSSGTQVVSYVYDSWGKLVSISGSQAETIGETNPFRYRGYYYDTETGLYYLNSRYYDPEVGRFLNIDSVMGVNGDIHTYNLFTYCGNNPVNRADPTGAATEAGTAPGILDVLIGLVVGAIEGATASASALGGLILSMPLWLTSSVDTSIVQPKVKAKTESRSLEIIKKFPETYFGAAIDKKSGEWAIVTAPMTMDQAILWTQLTGMSGIFNTNDSWGIYTLNPINSYKIALCMSGWEIPYGPEHHKYGEFAHYHPGSRKMLGRYKHFHFWFGLPY